jgi:hypothetical protein
MAGLFLSAPLGGVVTPKFEAGGVSELYLVAYNKITSAPSTKDDFGSDIEITDVNMVSGVTFQQVKIVRDATSVSDGFKLNGSKKFSNVSIAFSVDASGSAFVEQVHQLILGGPYVALYKRKNGRYYILGLSDGLEATEVNGNSGAKPEDESAYSLQVSTWVWLLNSLV